MKKFLIRILVFGISFFLIEKIFYLLLLVSPSLEKDNRLEKIINGKINKELIVMGSSRGARNIIAGQIEDSLGISSYNLSYPGSDIEFHEFLLESLLKFNKPPKIVLLAIDDPSELLPSESIKFRFDRLYPLAKYSYIHKEMIKRGEKDFLSNFFALSRINKYNFYIVKKHFNALDTIRDCGSMPISFQRKNRNFNYKSIENEYQSSNELFNKVEAFLKFQQKCISNNIELYMIFSPNFQPHNPSFEKRLIELSYPEVSFFVYDTINSIYRNNSYFYDEAHLQTNGAIIFTNEIINYLAQEYYKIPAYNN